MNLDDAYAALGHLVAMTPGWGAGETVDAYAAELAKLPDPRTLMEAVHRVAREWAEPHRPPLAYLLDIYRAEAARREPEVALPAEPPFPREQGVQVALREYRAECERQGREPDPELLARWIKEVP